MERNCNPKKANETNECKKMENRHHVWKSYNKPQFEELIFSSIFYIRSLKSKISLKLNFF